MICLTFYQSFQDSSPISQVHGDNYPPSKPRGGSSAISQAWAPSPSKPHRPSEHLFSIQVHARLEIMGGTRSFAAWQWSLAAFRARLSSSDCQRCNVRLVLRPDQAHLFHPVPCKIGDYGENEVFCCLAIMVAAFNNRSPLLRLPTLTSPYSNLCVNLISNNICFTIFT